MNLPILPKLYGKYHGYWDSDPHKQENINIDFNLDKCNNNSDDE